MSSEFVAYRKYTDINTANEVSKLLTANNIECLLQDNMHSYVKIVGYNEIEMGITLNVRSTDFEKADKILESNYAADIENIDKGYYLFDFSDNELKEIVDNPFDWGQFDQQLAKKILKEKGIEYSDAYIQNRKDEKTHALSQIKKVPIFKLTAGYIFSILIPVIGLLIGVTILYNRNLLPNGKKFYIHSANDRMHGRIIVGIAILWSAIIIFRII